MANRAVGANGLWAHPGFGAWPLACTLGPVSKVRKSAQPINRQCTAAPIRLAPIRLWAYVAFSLLIRGEGSLRGMQELAVGEAMKTASLETAGLKPFSPYGQISLSTRRELGSIGDSHQYMHRLSPNLP